MPQPENLWGLLKRRVWSHNFSSTTELKARITAVWNHGLEKKMLEKLVFSMTDQLRAIINGGQTQY